MRRPGDPFSDFAGSEKLSDGSSIAGEAQGAPRISGNLRFEITKLNYFFRA
jgi:hypothetical protein